MLENYGKTRLVLFGFSICAEMSGLLEIVVIFNFFPHQHMNKSDKILSTVRRKEKLTLSFNSTLIFHPHIFYSSVFPFFPLIFYFNFSFNFTLIFSVRYQALLFQNKILFLLTFSGTYNRNMTQTLNSTYFYILIQKQLIFSLRCFYHPMYPYLLMLILYCYHFKHFATCLISNESAQFQIGLELHM